MWYDLGAEINKVGVFGVLADDGVGALLSIP